MRDLDRLVAIGAIHTLGGHKRRAGYRADRLEHARVAHTGGMNQTRQLPGPRGRLRRAGYALHGSEGYAGSAAEPRAYGNPVPELVLGPVLRYVGIDAATVWVEADAPCQVEVLGHRERTFTVDGHHYALVCIGDLAPGQVIPYDVRLAGRPEAHPGHARHQRAARPGGRELRGIHLAVPRVVARPGHPLAAVDDSDGDGAGRPRHGRRLEHLGLLEGGDEPPTVVAWATGRRPDELERHEEYDAVRRAGDGGAALREFVEWVDSNGEGKVWSFKRDLGRTRLVVVDDRTGRRFEKGHRSILDDYEWDWVMNACRGDFDHLLFATTDPVLLAPGLHYAEAWNEAVCDGAWGGWAAARGEKLRRALDFDHWAAFRASFEKLERLLRELGRGERGRPPASIVLLSGDVHHAYLAEVGFRRDAEVRSAVYQAVCSPFRNALDAHERRAVRFALTPAGVAIGRGLARMAGARQPELRWRFVEGPFFDNQVATIEIEARRAAIKLEKTVGDPRSDERSLETVFGRRLA